MAISTRTFGGSTRTVERGTLALIAALTLNGLALFACGPAEVGGLSAPASEREPSTATEQDATFSCEIDSARALLAQHGGSVGRLHSDIIYQYFNAVTKHYGRTACGLMAAAAPYAHESADWETNFARVLSIMEVIEQQPELGYDQSYGVYPNQYALGLAAAFDGSKTTADGFRLPARQVKAWEGASLRDLAAALAAGATVIVEARVVRYPHNFYPSIDQLWFEHPDDECSFTDWCGNTAVATAQRPFCYNHSARVLAIDADHVFIENTVNYLTTYWVVGLAAFLEAWSRDYPSDIGCLSRCGEPESQSCPKTSRWMVTLSDGPLELDGGHAPDEGICVPADTTCGNVVQGERGEQLAVSVDATPGVFVAKANTSFVVQDDAGTVTAASEPDGESLAQVVRLSIDRRRRFQIHAASSDRDPVIWVDCAATSVPVPEAPDTSWIKARLLAHGHLSFRKAQRGNTLEVRRAIASFEGWNRQPLGEATLGIVDGQPDAATNRLLGQIPRRTRSGAPRMAGSASIDGLSEAHVLAYLRRVYDENNPRGLAFNTSPWGVNFVQIRGWLDGAGVQNAPDRYNDTIYVLVNDDSGQPSDAAALEASADYGSLGWLEKFGERWPGHPVRGPVFGSTSLETTAGLFITKAGQVIGYQVGQHTLDDTNHGIGLIDPAWGVPSLAGIEHRVRAHVDFNRDRQIDALEMNYTPNTAVVSNVHKGSSGGEVGDWSAGCHPIATDGSYQAFSLLLLASGQAEAALQRDGRTYIDLTGERRNSPRYDQTGLRRVLGDSLLQRLRARLAALYAAHGMPDADRMAEDGSGVWNGPPAILRDQIFPFAVADSRALPNPAELFSEISPVD